jgi:polyisoprenyl-phosphate glycosyltransferase
MNDFKQLISIVIPFYNEQNNVTKLYESISQVIDNITSYKFEIICVDDGSSDETLALLLDIVREDCRYKVIELSRNFSKESALTAGINYSNGEAVIMIDSDLQNPPNLIVKMIKEWEYGYDTVIAKRINRDTSDPFSRMIATRFFYYLHNMISDTKVLEGLGDFRLINKSMVEVLRSLKEQQRFMKGLFAWVGFKSKIIEYEHQVRNSGMTRFSWWKLWKLAIDGITSFSDTPLRICTYIGSFFAGFSIIYMIFVIMKTMILGIDVPGYASLLVMVLFLGGLQLISLGVLGEYIGRMYIETKCRPPYVIRKIYDSASINLEI